MQETGSKISPSVNIIDESFHLESIRYYQLFIELSQSDLSYCIFDYKRNKYLVLRSYNFDDFETKQNSTYTIQQVVLTDELLRQKDFNQVHISVVNNTSTLVPMALYDESKKNELLGFNQNLGAGDKILTDHLNSIDAKNIFSVPIDLYNLIKESFASADVHHHSSALIESVSFEYKNMQAPIVTAHIRSNYIDVVITQNKKLLFYNSFPFKTSEDYIYYILFVFEQLELNPETVNLVLKGNIDRNHDLYKISNKYVRNVSFGNRPDTFSFSYRFDNLAHHRFTTLLNQHLCA